MCSHTFSYLWLKRLTTLINRRGKAIGIKNGNAQRIYRIVEESSLFALF